MTFLRLRGRPDRSIGASVAADKVVAKTLKRMRAEAPRVPLGSREIKEQPVRTKRAIVAAFGAALIIGVYAIPALANEPPPPILGEPLSGRAAFVDDIGLKIKISGDESGTTVVNADDPSYTVVVRYTVQPGAQFPWHTHAGPVVVNVVSGALTYIGAEDCAEQTYTAGQAFVDAGHGHAHSAVNPTDSPTILIATFFEAPASGALLIPAESAAC
jgi:quercetin dioxygenase-like cupin family protein